MTERFFKKVEHKIMPNGFRNTTYERQDGSLFYVAIPKIEIRIKDEPQEWTYNELTEMECALRMFKIKKRDAS